MTSDDAQSIADRVQAQYERFPYPQPIERISGKFLDGSSYHLGCPKNEFPLYWPTLPEREDLDILVAGCGSSQAAIMGATVPKACIVAIDFSETSLERSRALARRHGVTNVTHVHKSLIDVGELGRDFDLIVSSGVIHHLPDPAAGLKALRQVLRPMGSMLVMVYGRFGRDGVYLFQDMFRRLGLTPETVTPESIRWIAHMVTHAPPSHPMNLRRFFFGEKSEAEIVDLFLNPRDVAFTVPEIYDLVERCDLAVQAWYHRAHYSPRCLALTDHPFNERLERLPERERFAFGELYRAAVHKHFFVACRTDRPRATYVPDFEGDRFLAMVPRFWKSFIVAPRRDGQPGIEGRLDKHFFDTLRVNFNPAQQRVISLIDGQRSIGAIAEMLRSAGDAATAHAFLRGLVKDLWEFDFVFLKFPG